MKHGLLGRLLDRSIYSSPLQDKNLLGQGINRHRESLLFKAIFYGDSIMNRAIGFACVVLTAGAATSGYAASLPALYSTQQAKDGQMVFTQNCAACHSGDLSGGVGPALIGQAFSAPENKNTVGSIFSFLSTQMPDGSGGSLSHTQYEDVMAFILNKNGYPAGPTNLAFPTGAASKLPLISQVK